MVPARNRSFVPRFGVRVTAVQRRISRDANWDSTVPPPGPDKVGLLGALRPRSAVPVAKARRKRFVDRFLVPKNVGLYRWYNGAPAVLFRITLRTDGDTEYVRHSRSA
jgi:hypothetical protein